MELVLEEDRCLTRQLQRQGIPAKTGETVASLKGLNQMSLWEIIENFPEDASSVLKN